MTRRHAGTGVTAGGLQPAGLAAPKRPTAAASVAMSSFSSPPAGNAVAGADRQPGPGMRRRLRQDHVRAGEMGGGRHGGSLAGGRGLRIASSATSQPRRRKAVTQQDRAPR
jgi:hypothetical protein